MYPNFRIGFSYSVNDIVRYNDKLYKCVTEHWSRYFDSTKWVIADDVDNTVDQVVGVSDLVYPHLLWGVVKHADKATHAIGGINGNWIFAPIQVDATSSKLRFTAVDENNNTDANAFLMNYKEVATGVGSETDLHFWWVENGKLILPETPVSLAGGAQTLSTFVPRVDYYVRIDVTGLPNAISDSTADAVVGALGSRRKVGTALSTKVLELTFATIS